MNPFSDQLVLWVINVLIHSTVLTAVLLCVAMLFRKRAAMRYWILCCGLLLVLASPAVSALVQSQGSGWLALALPNETVPAASVAVTEQPTPANDVADAKFASTASQCVHHATVFEREQRLEEHRQARPA